MTLDESLRRGPVVRLRFLLAGALALIAIAHLILVLVSPGVVSGNQIPMVTSIGGVIATCVSIFLARAIARYPGVEASAYLLPSFFISYGALLTGFLLSRLGYSRALLLADFILTLAWTMGLAAVTNRRALRVGVVPEGRFQPLMAAPMIDCVLLSHVDVEYSKVDAVAADLHHNLSSDWERSLADCALRGVPVYHTKHLIESLTGKVELQHLSENSFGMLTPVSIFMTVKHSVDWVVAMVLAVILSPAFAVLSLAIRLDSPGPAIFKQERIGYRGRPFTVYKFRTMTTAQPGAGSALDAAKTRDGDQRITKLGAFLRRTRVDELPQIFNILRGEMSWIGPRPEARVLSEWYEAELPFYRYRHIVRPGITGWAQVNQGHVAEISEVRDKLYYDFYYIKHYSFWIDILIIARTAITVFTGSGAK